MHTRKAPSTEPNHPRPALSDPLHTIPEVAEAIRAPVNSVRWLIQVGRIAATRPGRRVLVRRSEIERYIAAGEARSAGGGK